MTPELFEELVGLPLASFSHDCHAASISLVKAGVRAGKLPETARVARGSCERVPGQHSWIVLDGDCYARDAKILDPTLWSFVGAPPFVWAGVAGQYHRPHGSGSIWQYGKPVTGGETPIELTTPLNELSLRAQRFLEMLLPLDRRGWAMLAHAPVDGWPAGEIISAMYQTPAISALIPLDVVGMITDHNPQGLYLPA